MLRAEFYTEIDDWLAYNFNLLGAPFPDKSFKNMFLLFLESEIGNRAVTDADQMMPWKIIKDRSELDNMLPDLFTKYLNKRSAL